MAKRADVPSAFDVFALWSDAVESQLEIVGGYVAAFEDFIYVPPGEVAKRYGSFHKQGALFLVIECEVFRGDAERNAHRNDLMFGLVSGSVGEGDLVVVGSWRVVVGARRVGRIFQETSGHSTIKSKLTIENGHCTGLHECGGCWAGKKAKRGPGKYR
ncbi:hypothetical protein [Burkholderia multivorans]|uniref:hypothetical protein n=1 Tax=Burkholderia multivorans TaxID=87883 RepID=UPI0020B3306A|nr:hypothetical protein [Burkholderia multivorans]